MIAKPKVTFIFDPNVCSSCSGKIAPGTHGVTWKTLIDGIERRFRFCPVCIGDDQPIHERCRELLRRTIGVEDADRLGDLELDG